MLVFLVTGLINDGSTTADGAAAPAAAAEQPRVAGGAEVVAQAATASTETTAGPDAQAITAMADCSPFDQTALELAAAQFIDQLGAIRQELFGWLAELGAYPWAFTLLAAAAVYEHRRRQRRRAQKEAGKTEDDATFAWSLGLGGLAAES
jgi:hypothetical protein